MLPLTLLLKPLSAIAPLLALTLGTLEPAAPPSIEHSPVACVLAGRFPRIEARSSPFGEGATARIYFQGATSDWYAVSMKTENGVLVGVLPKPKGDLKSFRYYIEVVNQAVETSRTPEYATRVVDRAAGCQGQTVAAVAAGASIVIQAPAGVASVPAGFASTGIVAAGGGISATTLGVLGAAVGGGAFAVVKAVAPDLQEFAGPFSFDLSLRFGPGCTRVERHSGTVAIEISDTGGSSFIESGRLEILSTTAGCTSGPQPGQVQTFGANGAATRSGASISFDITLSGPTPEANTTAADHYTFSGTLSNADAQNGSITGTLTKTFQIDGPNGRVVSTTPSTTVTLTRR